MSDSDNNNINNSKDNNLIVPVLPLRDIVIFPDMVVPLFVGREKSVLALENVMNEDKQILLVTQKDANQDNPSINDLHDIGTIGNVLQLLKLPDSTVKVLVEGKIRAKVKNINDDDAFFQAEIEEQNDEKPNESSEAIIRLLMGQFEQYVKLNKKVPSEVMLSIQQIKEPGALADNIIQHLNVKIEDKQEVLEIFDVAKRLERVYEMMEGELGILQVEKRIRSRVKKQMEKTQREYYLNEQMKAIQKELNNGEDGKDEITELEEKAEKIKLSKEAREKFKNEVKKLRSMSLMSAEAGVLRNYLEWLIAIPWQKRSRLKTDLDHAERILSQDHFGLEKVKERIIEYLAVQKRAKKIRGPILCLVGPPGVGKTSLGRSIANATNREFIRMSLGGVRDEAEMRGHRRTYIGSMPGRIIQGMKKAGTSNPLFLLDEIDKLGNDWRGDPSAALLEILDPEQNRAFNDHYMEVDYDLSDVMFVTTANSLNMPQPLLDRMEIIQLSGYTQEEKVEIAKRHLIPKQVKENCLKDSEFFLSEKSVVDLIRYYTREAGVRNLEREISRVARKAVTKITRENKKSVKITPQSLPKLLGPHRFRDTELLDDHAIGHVNGLAWTSVGGVLLNIESVKVPGNGKLTYTGKLGEVMRESIQAAEYCIKGRCVSLGIKPTIYKKNDIHVHVPEGAQPKDGPSAGIAMITSIVSALTKNPVNREVAMTGEVTLRGQVLPIGGLKEKLLAALRAGIKTVIIPKDNEKDLQEIPNIVIKGMKIIPVDDIDQVLKVALINPVIPIEWNQDDEDDDDNANKSLDNNDKDEQVTTH